ncbi:MAG: LysR family transcriptional regulator [Bulleidia sp.]
MDIRQLKYFLAIAEAGSITRASEQLHISQPALSKTLRQLEEELECSLFTFSGHRAVLTENGMLLRERALEITTLLDSAENELKKQVSFLSGDIMIGCGEFPFMRKIYRVISEFQKENTKVRIHVYTGSHQMLEERLRSGADDFGFTISPPDARKYEYHALRQKARWGLCVHKDSSLYSHTLIRREDLFREPLITSEQSLHEQVLSEWLGRPAEELDIRADYSMVYNGIQMAEEGMGSVLLLEGLMPGNKDFRFIPLEPELSQRLYLFRVIHHRFSPAADTLYQILLNQ